MALSTMLNHLPPLTPLPSADTMRSVQIEASAHHQVRGCPPAASPPCLALAALSGLSCSMPNLAHPASCLPSLKAVLLPAPLAVKRLRYYEGSDSWGSPPDRQASPPAPPCPPDIPSSPTLAVPRSLCTSPQRRGFVPGFRHEP